VKKLRLTMILFGVLIALPLAFLALRTYGALERETRAQVRFFSERLLDEIEAELASLVRREENRVVDEYRHMLVQADGTRLSPLAGVPSDPFILGYFQNNPDGTFQTPLAEDLHGVPADLADRIDQLEAVNTIFNQRKWVAQLPSPVVEKSHPSPAPAMKEQSAFADRFLKSQPRKKAKSVLGRDQAKVEEITAGQAMNLARRETDKTEEKMVQGEGISEDEAQESATPGYGSRTSSSGWHPEDGRLRLEVQAQQADIENLRFQVEVAPLQAVAIDDSRMFIFRRIGVNGQMYRQGFVLLLQPFVDHLLAAYFDPQPISGYTRLTLTAAGFSVTRDRGGSTNGQTANARIAGRTFPVPFDFLIANMQVVSLPPSPARRVLTLTLSVLGVVMVVGLVMIYYSAKAVLDLSERRSGFVSAVTHELKTPLTNIRMYIEMLDSGIAATPEREHEYMEILASESARLSGLINNVLELSRLEKQARRVDLKAGDLKDVLADVKSAMADSLDREGVQLRIDMGEVPVFAYDRDVLVQVLVNLMENSIKFGRHLPEKKIAIGAHAENGWIRLTVSDTGPGIPRRSLKKVFDDFYRVDNELARSVGGTGIGLALVKKLILAMGGRVRAENNDGPGCTITLCLPASRQT
jgi:signal transduction histidine kinase